MGTVRRFCGHKLLPAFDLAEPEVPPVFLRSDSRVLPPKLIGKRAGGDILHPVQLGLITGEASLTGGSKDRGAKII